MTKDELVGLAIHCTKMPREKWDTLTEIHKDDAAMNRQMKEDWNLKPRDSDQAVIDYYRESGIWFINTFNHGYKALLALANRDPGSLSWQGWQDIFVKHLAQEDRILDYGGGFWNDTALLALKGYTVVQGEVEGPTTDFLEQFIVLAGMQNLEILKINCGRPLEDIYGGISCFETLEHLLDPKAFTEHLRDHLTPGKPFALSVSFGAPEHAPYHVASNEPLGRGETWWGIMKEIGFDHLWAATDCHKQVWRKR